MARGSKGLAMLLVAAVVLAGCGGDDGGKDSADAPRRTTSTTEAPTTTTEPKPPTAQPARVQVTFADDSCDLPAELPAGPTRFAATNTSRTARGLALVALDDGQTMADLLARFAEDAEEVVATNRFGAGPNGLPPGGSGAVQLDLQAGSYVALCQVPTTRELPAATGSIRPLTVKAPATEVEGSALPSGPTITLTDKAIEVPEGFSGKGLFRVENTGEFPHEILIYRVAEDTTFNEAVAWLTAKTPPKGSPKASLTGGVTALSSDQEAAIDLDLSGGIYIFTSFLSGADGKGDETNGLIEQVNLP